MDERTKSLLFQIAAFLSMFQRQIMSPIQAGIEAGELLNKIGAMLKEEIEQSE